jgi:peptide/nickel transport system permease protein
MTRGTRCALALIALLLSLVIVGPMVAPPRNVMAAMGRELFSPPSSTHWLGTDQLSRDVFARLTWGGRVSLAIATIAVVLAALIGSGLGLLAASSSRWLRAAIQRLINLSLSLPRIIILFVVIAAAGRLSPLTLGILLGLTGWPPVARLVRGEALRLRGAAYVTAARALGAPELRILRREIFPGTLPAVAVTSTLGLADAILLEAGLSFLGIGIAPPDPSWGGMVLEARDYLASHPWLMVAPCVALVMTTSAATLLGSSLRRSLQPGAP